MKQKMTYLVLAVLFAFCALLTVFSSVASNAAAVSLSMCIKSLIPSLFPYMVVSSMLVSCGASEKASRFLPVAKIFGLPGDASGAIILGALCGFPLGAKTAVDLYKRGTVSKTQAEALISVANNTGPSFVVAVIGAGFWKSAAFGWWLYFFQLVFAALSGTVVNRLIFPLPREKEKRVSMPTQKSFPVIFSSAVSDSVSAILNVCGFVMFFAVLSSYVCILTDRLSPILSAAVLSISELTGAAEYSALLASGNLCGAGGFFAGFSLGFSGLSVFCQAAAFTLPCGLSLKRTFAVKLLQGLLCGAAAAFAAEKYSFSVAAPAMSMSAVPTLVCAAVLCLISVKILIKS